MPPPLPGALDLALPAALAPQAAAFEVDCEELVVALYDEHAARLLRYIRGSGLDTAAAEDVLQDTFVALHRHLLLDRQRANLVGWLFQVAHNLSRREHRRRRRGLAPVAWDAARVSLVIDPEPTPEHQFARLEMGRRVQAAVNQLPERDQRCLELRADGLRYRDIAVALGMSLGWVAKSVARSLAHLASAAKS